MAGNWIARLDQTRAASAAPAAPAPRAARFALPAAICAVAFFFVEHQFSISRTYLVSDESLEARIASGDQARRLAFLALGLLGAATAATRRRKALPRPCVLLVLLACFFGLCFLSVAWSYDRGITLRRFGALFFFLACAAGLAWTMTLRELCLMVLTVTAAHLAFGVAAEASLGQLAPWRSGYRFAGTIHPNTQAIQCAALCLAAFCLRQEAKGQWRRLLGLAFWTGLAFLLLTRSRTSLAVFVVTFYLMWLPAAPRVLRVLTTALTPLLLVGGAFVVTVFFHDSESLGNAVLLGREEESGTLTGRLPLWRELSGYVQREPLLGYGYGAFWNVERSRRIANHQGWEMAHSHSGYIETVLAVGFLGGFLLLSALLTAAVWAERRYRQTGEPGYHFVFGFSVFAMLYSFNDAGFALPNFMTMVVIMGMVAVALESPK